MSLDISFHAVKLTEVYENNITHNLGRMAKAAGLYMVLWRPAEIDIKYAGDMIPILERGIRYMTDNPATLIACYTPENGWGTYENLLKFAEDTLESAAEYPDALVEVSR